MKYKVGDIVEIINPEYIYATTKVRDQRIGSEFIKRKMTFPNVSLFPIGAYSAYYTTLKLSVDLDSIEKFIQKGVNVCGTIVGIDPIKRISETVYLIELHNGKGILVSEHGLHGANPLRVHTKPNTISKADIKQLMQQAIENYKCKPQDEPNELEKLIDKTYNTFINNKN